MASPRIDGHGQAWNAGRRRKRDFARLHALRDELARNLPPGVSLDELSMGMSDDFEVAIGEGATIVRVGSGAVRRSRGMISLEDHAEGVVLPVRAHAAARRNAIDGEKAGCLQVSVTQSAEKGKANKALVAVLSKSLGLRKSQIELVAGEASPQKRFLIRGVTKVELAQRIEQATTTS